MRSNATSTGIVHLPNELLSEILKNLDKIQPTSAYTCMASLTCRRFHSLAKPLIFSRVNFTCQYEDVSRQSTRLDFYSSDAIAPFVRNFRMSGVVPLGHFDIDFEPEAVNLIADIFDTLPRFINIRSFFCSDFTFTQFALHQLSTLPSLKNILVWNCSAPPKIKSLPMLHLRTFAFLADTEEERVGVDHWLALLDPEGDHLQVLNIPLTEDVCAFFLTNGNSSPHLFPSLHTIDLDANHEMLRLLPGLLSKTPALRSLKLGRLYAYPESYIHMFERLVPPTACPVPHLEEYRGPHKLLPIILGRETGFPSAQPRRLHVEYVTGVQDPLAAFMNSFKSCHPLHLRALTHLHISLFRSMDLNALADADLQNMFPVLQEFYLHVAEISYELGHFPDVDLTDLYTLPLPSTLVSLSMQWTQGGRDAGAVPDLVAAKDSLLSRLPHLRRLWLYDISRLALLWSRPGLPLEDRCTLQQVASPVDSWALRRVVFPEISFFRL